MKKVDFLTNCLLPLVHSPWAFIQTRLNRHLFLYNSYFWMTSRLQKLLSLSLTQLGLYLNLIPSITRTPCLDLLGLGSYLILISSPTRIHIISLLNRICISLMLSCVSRSLIQSKEDLLSLPDALPGHLTRVFTWMLTRVLPEHLTRQGYWWRPVRVESWSFGGDEG
jgi:hypothetical protein